MLLIPLKPHLPAALLMFTFIVLMAFEPSLNNRIIYVGGIAIAFTAFLIMFGVEYEITGREGWRKYAERMAGPAQAGTGKAAERARGSAPVDIFAPQVRVGGRGASERRPDYG